MSLSCLLRACVGLCGVWSWFAFRQCMLGVPGQRRDKADCLLNFGLPYNALFYGE